MRPLSLEDLVYHVAGEPVALVQRCLRCRAILTDNNGAMVADADNRGPMFLPAYRVIEVRGGYTGVASEVSAEDVRVFMCQSTEVFQ